MHCKDSRQVMPRVDRLNHLLTQPSASGAAFTGLLGHCPLRRPHTPPYPPPWCRGPPVQTDGGRSPSGLRDLSPPCIQLLVRDAGQGVHRHENEQVHRGKDHWDSQAGRSRDAFSSRMVRSFCTTSVMSSTRRTSGPQTDSKQRQSMKAATQHPRSSAMSSSLWTGTGKSRLTP